MIPRGVGITIAIEGLRGLKWNGMMSARGLSLQPPPALRQRPRTVLRTAKTAWVAVCAILARCSGVPPVRRRPPMSVRGARLAWMPAGCGCFSGVDAAKMSQAVEQTGISHPTGIGVLMRQYASR